MATLAERQATYGKFSASEETSKRLIRQYDGKVFVNLKRPSPDSQMNSSTKTADEISATNESETKD